MKNILHTCVVDILINKYLIKNYSIVFREYKIVSFLLLAWLEIDLD